MGEEQGLCCSFHLEDVYSSVTISTSPSSLRWGKVRIFWRRKWEIHRNHTDIEVFEW